MIDAEVIRLRRLRRTALLTRGLARRLQPSFPDESAFARGAVSAWSVSRLINGRLGAHPNLSCQQGPGLLQTSVDHCLAALTGWVAVKQGRAHSVLLEQLQILARELDDTRALTWSAELGDALCRAQWQLLRLRQDLAVGTRRESGARIQPPVEAASGAPSGSTDWPYLAI